MNARFPDISPVCVSSGNPCLESQIKEHIHIKIPSLFRIVSKKTFLVEGKVVLWILKITVCLEAFPAQLSQKTNNTWARGM